MGYQLKAIVQRTIVFTVQVVSGLIGNIQDLFGIGGTFSTAVYLQFYAKKRSPSP